MYMENVNIVYNIVYIHPIYTLFVYILFTYRHQLMDYDLT